MTGGCPDRLKAFSYSFNKSWIAPNGAVQTLMAFCKVDVWTGMYNKNSADAVYELAIGHDWGKTRWDIQRLFPRFAPFTLLAQLSASETLLKEAMTRHQCRNRELEINCIERVAAADPDKIVKLPEALAMFALC